MSIGCRSLIIAFVGLLTVANAGALRPADFERADLKQLGRAPGPRRNRGTARGGGLLVKFRGERRVRAFQVAEGEATEAAKRARARDDVEFVEKNRKVTRQYVPSDPLVDSQWHHATIGSAAAWDWGTGSASVKIAIVDAPFNLAHPDLAANAAAGWDVLNEVPIGAGDDDHASMSAGMAAAVLGNGKGVAGAGNCVLVPINNAYADLTSDIALMDAAIRWAADHGIRVVNLSWAGVDSKTLNLAAQYHRARTDGVVVMAGENGTGRLDYTNQPYIVAVSMTDADDALQSRYGPHIDFAAPGFQVYSTTAAGYDAGSGSSFAAPLVAGMFATLFSINPSMTAQEAIETMRASAVDLGPAGWDEFYGWGRVDFGAAAWLAAASAGAAEHLGGEWFETEADGWRLMADFHPGVRYALEAATNLTPGAWSALDVVPRTNGAVVECTVGAGDHAAAFYRIVGELDF